MTPKQQRFVNEYTKGPNATQAAIKLYQCRPLDRLASAALGGELPALCAKN